MRSRVKQVLVRWLPSVIAAVMVFFAVGGLPATASASPILQVDQQNSVGGTTAQWYSALAMVFTPSLAAIDAVEFKLRAVGGPASSEVELLSNLPVDGFSIGGTVLATSNTVVITETPGFVTYHFDFPTTISLTPGELYAFHPTQTDFSKINADASFSNPYPSGGIRTTTTNFEDQDYVFLEGVHVPEPSTAILLACGLAGLAVAGRRRPLH